MLERKTRLGEILAEKKITYDRAAELTGISIANIVRLACTECDYRTMKVDTLVKICAGINIKAIDLFPEEKESIARLSRKSRRKVR